MHQKYFKGGQKTWASFKCCFKLGWSLQIRAGEKRQGRKAALARAKPLVAVTLSPVDGFHADVVLPSLRSSSWEPNWCGNVMHCTANGEKHEAFPLHYFHQQLLPKQQFVCPHPTSDRFQGGKMKEPLKKESISLWMKNSQAFPLSIQVILKLRGNKVDGHWLKLQKPKVLVFPNFSQSILQNSSRNSS